MIDEEKETETKAPPEKIFSAREPVIAIPTTEMAQDVEQEKEMAKESLPPLLVETVVECPAEEKISKRKRRKVRKRASKKRRSAAFRLPRPCKVGICRPYVCCRDVFSEKLKIRYDAPPFIAIKNISFYFYLKYFFITCTHDVFFAKFLRQ